MTPEEARTTDRERLAGVPWPMRVSVWWHRKRYPGHHSLLRRVSVPSWDPSARGYLIRCTGCKRTWAA